MARKSLGATAAKETELIISVPMGDIPADGHEAAQIHGGKVKLERHRLHVQLQLGEKAAVALTRLRNGLRDRREMLPSGRPVWTNVDTIRWLMETIADAGEVA